MARNREPVLKRAKALGIEPQYMGINKKSKRQAQQSRRKQFRNLYAKAEKRPGQVGTNLLVMLESRFDNVVFRMGFAATRREARQLVNHGHFLVNGKKANIPSMELKAGDVITVKEKSQSSPKFKELKDMVITTPQWISIDLDKLEGKIVTAPSREDIDLPIAEHSIVEFYSR